jgi:hypothetical protein
MKRGIALITLVLLLAGCESVAYYVLRTGDPASAPVAVVGDYIVLGREPVVLKRKPGESVQATWTTPSGVQFEGPGIRPDARIKDFLPVRPGQPRILSNDTIRDTSQVKLIKCVIEEKSRAEVKCTVPPEVKSGLYAYTVFVTSGSRSLVLDPTFMLD